MPRTAPQAGFELAKEAGLNLDAIHDTSTR